MYGRTLTQDITCGSLNAAALDNHLAYALDELFVVLEVFDVEVHAIAPVVAGIGWYVDAFGISILQAQVFVGGKPVLKGDDA